MRRVSGGQLSHRRGGVGEYGALSGLKVLMTAERGRGEAVGTRTPMEVENSKQSNQPAFKGAV